MEKRVSSCVFDTSVWVGLFHPSDIHHEAARQAFSSVEWRIHIPYAALLETATVLTYKVSKEQADKFLDFILHDERCSVVSPDRDAECALFAGVAAKISFADMAIIQTAFRYQVPLITFDKQMKKIYERSLHTGARDLI